MRFNSKLGWGFAWTGLALILAVPSVDFLTGHFGGQGTTAAMLGATAEPAAPAVATPATAPSAEPTLPVVQKTASVTTRVTKTGIEIIPAGSPIVSEDPVDKLLKSGKPLPDYISDGDAPAAGTQAAATAPASDKPSDTQSNADQTQVASLGSEATPPLVAPVPFPSTARPPDTPLPRKADQPLVIDEAALAPDAGPRPPADIVGPDDWSARHLRHYLERRGLLDGDGYADDRSNASITIVERPSRNDYDPDGFYLSDGPNSHRAERRARIEQLFTEDDQDDYPDFIWY